MQSLETDLLESTLSALCALSNVTKPDDVGHLVANVKVAPDPETAVRQVLAQLPTCSDALSRKWRDVITDLWATNHPHIPLLPELSLSGADVEQTAVVRDAHAFLELLEEQPLQLIEEQDEWLLEPTAVTRLGHHLPSLKEQALPVAENEWTYPALRRLRALLHATRLIQPRKGLLYPVRTRLQRFRQLPPTQQFYILWHVDAYHTDWTRFAGLWGTYMRLVQEYLPLLWESIGSPVAGRREDRGLWAMNILEAFSPIWDDEGLLEVRRGHHAALAVVQHHALPTIIDRFLLRDLLERHGLISIKEEFGSLSKFTWTTVGEQLVAAEQTGNLPCGNELLALH